jgi:dynein light intermediate chain 2
VNNAKDISHIWELGGGFVGANNTDNVSELVATPLRQGLSKAVIVIAVDTAKAKNAIPSLNKWLAISQFIINEEYLKLRKEFPGEAEAMQARAEERVGANHPDAGVVNASVVPLVIVATKYDELKSEDSASRKTLMQALRFLAHANGASLVTASTKDKVSRDMWRSLARAALFQAPVKVAAKAAPVPSDEQASPQDAAGKKRAGSSDEVKETDVHAQKKECWCRALLSAKRRT